MSRPGMLRRLNRRALSITDPNSVNISSLITNTRATEASYQTQAENDGSTAFLAWAAPNVLRMQNRGTRDAIFIEGSRTNLTKWSEDFTNAEWTKAGTTLTGSQLAPDGGGDATRVAVISAGLLYETNGNTPGVTVSRSITAWYRRNAAPDAAPNPAYSASTVIATAALAVSTYSRIRTPTLSCTGGVAGRFIPSDGRARTEGGIPTAGARDSWIWGTQVEDGFFPSSYIRTTSAALARSADLCVIASDAAPPWLRNSKYTITISLECTSLEFVAAATEMTLLSFGAGTNDRIALVLDGGNMKVRVVQGGVTKVTTGAISTVSAYTDITITIDSTGGLVTVSGASAGDGIAIGTAWTMQTGDIYVGNVSTGATPYFGEILPVITRVPSTASLSLPGVLSNTRATEASYQTQAANDGTTSFTTWASTNTLRIQNRGVRDAIFIEGSRTNYFLRSRQMTINAPWTAGTMAQTASAANGIDGTLTATQFTGTGAQFSSRQTVTTPAGTVMSIWGRAVSGTQPIRSNYAYPNGTTGVQTLTTTYAQHIGRVATLTTHTDYINDCSLSGNTSLYVDCIQSEVGTFPSSAIRTTTAAVTRDADVCIMPSSSVPVWMRSGSFSISVAPECSSVNLINQATEMTLLAYGTGTTDRVSLIVDAAGVKVRVVQGGVTKVTTGVITFARWGDFTITLDASMGYVVVTGATTGSNVYTGTPWSMQLGDVYLGNVSTGATPYFGEVLQTLPEVPSAPRTQSFDPQISIAATNILYFSGQYQTGLDGGALSWLDESGNADHAINSTVAAQPTMVLNNASYGNHNVLDFDGSADYYQTTSVAGGNNVVTVAWIGHADSVAGVRKLFETSTATAGAFAVFLESSKLSCWANGAAGQDYVAGDTTIVVGTRYLFIVEIPFSTLTSAAISSWVNNVQQTQTVISNTATNTTMITALWHVSRNAAAGTQFFDGRAAVLGAWSGSFTPTERTNFYTWAQANYGVA